MNHENFGNLITEFTPTSTTTGYYPEMSSHAIVHTQNFTQRNPRLFLEQCYLKAWIFSSCWYFPLGLPIHNTQMLLEQSLEITCLPNDSTIAVKKADW